MKLLRKRRISRLCILQDDYITRSESWALLVSNNYKALAKKIEGRTEEINKLVDMQQQIMH
jgi:hypothetical protein